MFLAETRALWFGANGSERSFAATIRGIAQRSGRCEGVAHSRIICVYRTGGLDRASAPPVWQEARSFYQACLSDNRSVCSVRRGVHQLLSGGAQARAGGEFPSR